MHTQSSANARFSSMFYQYQDLETCKITFVVLKSLHWLKIQSQITKSCLSLFQNPYSSQKFLGEYSYIYISDISHQASVMIVLSHQASEH